MLNRFRKFLYVHFDIPTGVILAVLVLLFWRPAAKQLFDWMGVVQTRLDLPERFGDFALGLATNIVSAAIIIPVVLWLFRAAYKADSAGRFDAFDTTSGTDVVWGEVCLSYNLFTSRMQAVLTHNDIVISIDAYMEKGMYLRGHYIEKTNKARRRNGALLLQLNGKADAYEGCFVYVDPDDALGAKPRSGTVAWRRKK